MIYLETAIIDIIEGRKKRQWCKGGLLILSYLFRACLTVKNFAFDHRLRKIRQVSIPVVSIGNIIAGGTGKTALIKMLAQDLQSEGKISILLRGYRSQAEKKPSSLHLTQKTTTSPQICGDEAYLLLRSVDNISLFVGKNRIQSAQMAADETRQLLLLDDGMQYRQLHRDIEIVMLHAHDLYGKGFYLPRGYLRDSPKRLKEADYIFIHHIDDNEHFHSIEKKINKHSNAPLIGTYMEPKCVLFQNGTIWEDLRQKRIGVFCALGKPDSFIATLNKMGAEVIATWFLPDHKAPCIKQLSLFIDRCQKKGCECLVCSEKDWVKLPQDKILTSFPIGYLQASMKVSSGWENYKKLKTEMIHLMKG